MEYCFNTNIDIWGTFKALTPYILALIVLVIWHWQKGKEVIANESKETIKNLLQIRELSINLIHNKFEDKTEIIKQLSEFKEKSESIYRSILFLENSKMVSGLDSLHKQYYVTYVDIYHPIDISINKVDIDKIKNIIKNEKNISNLIIFNNTCSEIIKILYPYSLYKFNLKAHRRTAPHT